METRPEYVVERLGTLVEVLMKDLVVIAAVDCRMRKEVSRDTSYWMVNAGHKEPEYLVTVLAGKNVNGREEGG